MKLQGLVRGGEPVQPQAEAFDPLLDPFQLTGIGVSLLHPAGDAPGVVDVDAVGADLGGEAQVLV